jgi:long-chain acyl-CoA synthetase
VEQKPWLKHYDPGIPYTLVPYPEVTFLDIVSETIKQRPAHPALLFKGKTISYSMLEQESNELAAALVAQGVEKGDRVALLLPNCPQTVIGQFGIWKAGAITVLMNPLYTEDELEQLLNECGAEIVIVLTSFYNKLKSIQPHTKVHHVIATNIKEYLPPVTRWLFTLVKEKKEGYRIALRPGDMWLQNLLRQHAGSGRPDIKINPGDPAMLLFSGGTTGTPKAAIGTHKALVTSAIQLHTWFSGILKDWDDVVMQVLPLFHVYGNAAVLGTALIGHNPVALVPNPRDQKDLITTIHKVHPAFLSAVPTLFIALINNNDVRAGKVDFKSMKLCTSGAAPLLAETKKNFEELTGCRLLDGYGLTESMMGAVIQPVNGIHKAGSVGLPITDIEVRIVDMETGLNEMPVMETGEIIMKASQLMQGYWERPTETAETIRNGWLYTGDIGYMDEDGYLFISARKKDMIKSGSGFQIWPREIEEVIAEMSVVSEVCAAGVPDPIYGETLKVWIVFRGGQQCSADDIQDFCRKKLTAYKVPRMVEFCESLPKSMVGKVLRRVLVEEHKAKQLQTQK